MSATTDGRCVNLNLSRLKRVWRPLKGSRDPGRVGDAGRGLAPRGVRGQCPREHSGGNGEEVWIVAVQFVAGCDDAAPRRGAKYAEAPS